MASIFTRFATLGIVAVLLQITGLLLFVLGFFPVKPALDGVSAPESFLPGCEIDGIEKINYSLNNEKYEVPEERLSFPAKYDRLVLMIIDGLPAEFLLGRDGNPPAQHFESAMPFAQNLLATGFALGYHAKAAPPTVTMPRLKAMTSGSIAGFLDVAYNFNTQKLLEDNMIGQLARAGWRMVMLGDETWLKLFPQHFERHDGVSSFYVTDTVEVDSNVTRHLNSELERNDWNLLILHYLGLDHVGHLGGRNSPLMVSKLREMDDVIRRIHQTVLTKSPLASRTLLVVASDHGMTDGGNHGGATYQETDALALFIEGSSLKPPFQVAPQSATGSHRSDAAYQVDLVPTMALLLGKPIPRNSVGTLLHPLFSSLPPKLQLKALELNSWQLLRLVKRRSPHSTCIANVCHEQGPGRGHQSSYPSQEVDNAQKFCTLFREAVEKHKQWAHNGGETLKFAEAKEAYLQFLKPTSAFLATGSTEKRRNFILSGVLLMLFSTSLFLFGVHRICKITSEGSPSISQNRKEATSFLVKFTAIGGVFLIAASFGSSSFVEEEQFTWHFLVSTILVAFVRVSLQKLTPDHDLSLGPEAVNLRYEKSEKRTADEHSNRTRYSTTGILEDKHLAMKKTKSTIKQVTRICLLLVIGRVLRSWHRSGVNWAHLPDVAKALEVAQPSTITLIRAGCLFIVTLMCCLLLPKSLPRFIHKITVIFLILSANLLFLWLICDFLRLNPRSDSSKIETCATLSVRGVYGVLVATALLCFITFPWIITARAVSADSRTSEGNLSLYLTSVGQKNSESGTLDETVKLSMYATGIIFVSCWCLLQLLLQQPVNAVPLLLLLLQLMITVKLFRAAELSSHRWISILTLHWLGASGHFGLGNSNTLATVDVAGAYMGLSSHSTVLSGMLAFIITYGSPLLYMQGLLLTVSPAKKREPNEISKFSQQWLLEEIALPCFLPMALNGVVLTVFTGVLIIMQDHLFVWSVFSPKYLYVVASTVCTYIGTLTFAAVGGYSTFVISRRIQEIIPVKRDIRMD